MSKAEIIEEIKKLTPAERHELWEAMWDLEESLRPGENLPTEEEKILLREDLEEYRRDGDDGKPWEEIEKRLRGDK